MPTVIMSIEKLQHQLQRAISRFESASDVKSLFLVEPVRLQSRLHSIEKLYQKATELQPASTKTINAITQLENNSLSLSTREWGYIAWGLNVNYNNNGKLINQIDLCNKALVHFEHVFQSDIRRNTWFGLLFSYFSLDITDMERNPVCWLKLRELLKKSFYYLYEQSKNPRDWMRIIHQNPDILTSDIVEKMASSVLIGDMTYTDSIRKHLNITGNSWVWLELFKEQIRQACQAEDAIFYSYIDRVLLASQSYQNHLNDVIKSLLDRYQRSGNRDIVSASLKTVSFEKWGSPQLQTTTSWGLVRAETKAMVLQWFAKDDLEHFFSMLQDNGTPDLRRLNFWLRYIGQISYTRIVLGRSSSFNKAIDFVNFRRINNGRFSMMSGAKDTNNAFILKIGQYYIVEFSETGNACYIYSENNMPFPYSKLHLDLKDLKNKDFSIKRISHNGDWELSMDLAMNQLGIFSDSYFRKDDTIKLNTKDDSLESIDKAARWMKERVISHSILYQSQAVSEIQKLFGDDFVYRQDVFSGLSIDKRILARFKKINEGLIRWDSDSKAWRLI